MVLIKKSIDAGQPCCGPVADHYDTYLIWDYWYEKKIDFINYKSSLEMQTYTNNLLTNILI